MNNYQILEYAIEEDLILDNWIILLLVNLNVLHCLAEESSITIVDNDNCLETIIFAASFNELL